jgi:hypothetical protein
MTSVVFIDLKRREFITLFGGGGPPMLWRTTMTKIRSFVGVACAAVAIASAMPAAAQDRGETITPHFEQAIPNIPGKSLVALVVDYAPGRGANRNQTCARWDRVSPSKHTALLRETEKDWASNI